MEALHKLPVHVEHAERRVLGIRAHSDRDPVAVHPQAAVEGGRGADEREVAAQCAHGSGRVAPDGQLRGHGVGAADLVVLGGDGDGHDIIGGASQVDLVALFGVGVCGSDSRGRAAVGGGVRQLGGVGVQRLVEAERVGVLMVVRVERADVEAAQAERAQSGVVGQRLGRAGQRGEPDGVDGGGRVRDVRAVRRHSDVGAAVGVEVDLVPLSAGVSVHRADLDIGAQDGRRVCHRHRGHVGCDVPRIVEGGRVEGRQSHIADGQIGEPVVLGYDDPWPPIVQVKPPISPPRVVLRGDLDDVDAAGERLIQTGVIPVGVAVGPLVDGKDVAVGSPQDHAARPLAVGPQRDGALLAHVQPEVVGLPSVVVDVQRHAVGVGPGHPFSHVARAEVHQFAVRRQLHRDGQRVERRRVLALQRPRRAGHRPPGQQRRCQASRSDDSPTPAHTAK